MKRLSKVSRKTATAYRLRCSADRDGGSRQPGRGAASLHSSSEKPLRAVGTSEDLGGPGRTGAERPLKADGRPGAAGCVANQAGHPPSPSQEPLRRDAFPAAVGTPGTGSKAAADAVCGKSR